MAGFAEACDKSRARCRQAELIVRQAPAGDVPIESAGGGPIPAMPNYGADRRIKRSYNLFRNLVYVCVNAVARRVASQPWTVLRQVQPTKGGAARSSVALKQFVRHGMVPKAAAVDGSLEVVSQHPLVDLLDRPNPVQGRWEFLYVTACNLLLTGQAYWVYDRDKKHGVMLWSVPSDWITPKHKGGLFTSYDLHLGAAETIKLPPDLVFRAYIPDPSNIRKCLSPLEAIAQTANIDQSILNSQEQSFASIYPNVVITVGKVRGADGSLSDRRPVLRGHHRRQIVGAIREIWNQTVNAGEPAILDGLIESIHKLNATPQEMDWQKSAEAIKRRIMQAYGVNPITVGETENANRAQAVEAEKQTASAIVNPIIRALSDLATQVAKRWYGGDMTVCLEPSEPIDPDLDLRRWTAARRQGDVLRNEFRSEILGLPPIDEETDRTPLLDSVEGMKGVVAILSSAGQGLIRPEQSAQLLQVFFGMSREDAESIAGLGQDAPPDGEPEVSAGYAGLLKGNPNDDEIGRFASSSGRRTGKQKLKKRTKSEIAKASAKRCDREIQRYSEEYNEPHLAKMVDGEALPDNEPIDILIDVGGRTDGLELKTMVDNKHKKITMDKDAIKNKRAWEKETGGVVHTVVFDDTDVKDALGPGKHDKRKRTIYYRRGYGSFRTTRMYKVKNYAELKRLVQMDDSELPPGAGR